MIFHSIEHWSHVPWVIQATLFAGGLLIFAGVLVRRRVATAEGGIVPDEGITVRNLVEVIVEWLGGLAEDRMGADWRRYFPLIGTMFFFILVSNLMGLVPGFDGATVDINTTAGWAVVSWVFYTGIGIRRHGLGGYIIKFMGPSFGEWKIGGRKIHVRALMPIFLPLEILLDLARMLTLSVRLFANMFADHTVIAVWVGLAPIVVPALFMGLGLIVSFLQAFIFALLTMIYIGLALEEPH